MTSTPTSESALLPGVPDALRDRPVAVWSEPVEIVSYEPQAPEPLPAFLNRRVYQGSSGRVYPLPFIDRIATEPVTKTWAAIHLENRWLRVLILPELGGRIHVALDKTTGYDFFYRNQVIKPALVGLAGPWMAGGVEFNWPQHHRPATWLPTDAEIVENADGSATVWCSDHDPFQRMKGMHGITLHPDRAVLELNARLYNRSDLTQTFLWWANVAARSNDEGVPGRSDAVGPYQSFFPTDVTMVADHAKRAVVGFPAADRPYYGVDYPARAGDTFTAGGETFGGDRLDFYRNIPVPTSYMCLGSEGTFFGGYDHGERAGFVHVADRHVSVGKKQWTWGNHPFGHAWDANLGDDGSAYVELMAGVFTDNQPDFAFLAPGETKTFTQRWFPIAEIGAPQAAGDGAAMRLDVDGDRLRVGLHPTADHAAASLTVRQGDKEPTRTVALTANEPFFCEMLLDRPATLDELEVTLTDGDTELVAWRATSASFTREAAVEPAPPAEIASVDELYRTGLHLEQNRHATRSPEPYWAEALRRDPGHADSATALGVRRYRQGRYAEARELLETATARLTLLNSNPPETSAYYHLGLTLARLGDDHAAANAFGRALWTRAWRAPAGWQLAILAARRGDLADAEARLRDVLACEPDHLQARDALVWLHHRRGRADAAAATLAATRVLDPLDQWARDLAGDDLTCDQQTVLDVALEYRRLGDHDAAGRLLAAARTAPVPSGAPRANAVIDVLLGGAPAARGDYEFPDRLDEYDALRAAATAHPDNAAVHALLGVWLYAHDRAAEAITAWSRAVELDPADWLSWRNLGLARFNDEHDAAAAQACYAAALEHRPEHPRLRYEADQLAARLGRPLAERRAALETEGRPLDRDDAVITWAHLCLGQGDLEPVRRLLTARRFQPWEGGEGEALRAWDRLHLLLTRQALDAGDAETAVRHAAAALEPPATLGEQRHLLANVADVHLNLGDAFDAADDPEAARAEWEVAAAQAGDFLDMATTPFSESTFSTLVALDRLGRGAEAERLAAEFARYLDELEATPAKVDFFATSLPSMLLFAEDVDQAQRRRVAVMRAQLALFHGERDAAREGLDAVLAEQPDHPLARDLRQELER